MVGVRSLGSRAPASAMPDPAKHNATKQAQPKVTLRGAALWAAAVVLLACPLLLIPSGAAMDGAAPVDTEPGLAKDTCSLAEDACDPTVSEVVVPPSSPTPTEPAPSVAATPPPTETEAACQVSGHQTVVFLDPGHGANVTPRPAESGGSEGIYSGESANGQEDIDVFAVAIKVQAGLEEAGYVVVLSRQAQPDPEGLALWQRGNAAEVANGGQPADIGISIHTDLASSVGAGQIYYNNLGGFRQNNADSTRRTFDNAATAATAERYAKVFQTVRGEDQQGTITITAGHEFPAGRNLGSHGDIPIVMLSAPSVPWVYNEFGRTDPAGLSEAQIDVYASSLIRATQQAIGPTEGTGPEVTTCP